MYQTVQFTLLMFDRNRISEDDGLTLLSNLTIVS